MTRKLVSGVLCALHVFIKLLVFTYTSSNALVSRLRQHLTSDFKIESGITNYHRVLLPFFLLGKFLKYYNSG